MKMEKGLLKRFFPSIQESTEKKIFDFAQFYTELNQEINLTSRQDIEAFFPHHILPALAISDLAVFPPASRILDIGTGGGLPGLPLGIVNQQANFVLIDSIAKKIRIVASLIDRLALSNVEARNARSNEVKEKFDYVIGRGVTDPASFAKLARKNLKEKKIEGRIFYISGSSPCHCQEKIELSSFFSGLYYQGKFIYIF